MAGLLIDIKVEGNEEALASLHGVQEAIDKIRASMGEVGTAMAKATEAVRAQAQVQAQAVQASATKQVESAVKAATARIGAEDKVAEAAKRAAEKAKAAQEKADAQAKALLERTTAARKRHGEDIARAEAALDAKFKASMERNEKAKQVAAEKTAAMAKAASEKTAAAEDRARQKAEAAAQRQAEVVRKSIERMNAERGKLAQKAVAAAERQAAAEKAAAEKAAKAVQAAAEKSSRASAAADAKAAAESKRIFDESEKVRVRAAKQAAAEVAKIDRQRTADENREARKRQREQEKIDKENSKGMLTRLYTDLPKIAAGWYLIKQWGIDPVVRAIQGAIGAFQALRQVGMISEIARNLGQTAEQADRLRLAAIGMAAALGGTFEERARQLTTTLGGFPGELGERIAALKSFSQEQLRAGAAIEFAFKNYAAFIGRGKSVISILNDIGAQWTLLKGKIWDAISANEHFNGMLKEVSIALNNLLDDPEAIQQFADFFKIASQSTLSLAEGLLKIWRVLESITNVFVTVQQLFFGWTMGVEGWGKRIAASFKGIFGGSDLSNAMDELIDKMQDASLATEYVNRSFGEMDVKSQQAAQGIISSWTNVTNSFTRLQQDVVHKAPMIAGAARDSLESLSGSLRGIMQQTMDAGMMMTQSALDIVTKIKRFMAENAVPDDEIFRMMGLADIKKKTEETTTAAVDVLRDYQSKLRAVLRDDAENPFLTEQQTADTVSRLKLIAQALAPWEQAAGRAKKATDEWRFSMDQLTRLQRLGIATTGFIREGALEGVGWIKSQLETMLKEAILKGTAMKDEYLRLIGEIDSYMGRRAFDEDKFVRLVTLFSDGEIPQSVKDAIFNQANQMRQLVASALETEIVAADPSTSTVAKLIGDLSELDAFLAKFEEKTAEAVQARVEKTKEAVEKMTDDLAMFLSAIDSFASGVNTIFNEVTDGNTRAQKAFNKFVSVVRASVSMLMSMMQMQATAAQATQASVGATSTAHAATTTSAWAPAAAVVGIATEGAAAGAGAGATIAAIASILSSVLTLWSAFRVAEHGYNIPPEFRRMLVNNGRGGEDTAIAIRGPSSSDPESVVPTRWLRSVSGYGGGGMGGGSIYIENRLTLDKRDLRKTVEELVQEGYDAGRLKFRARAI